MLETDLMQKLIAFKMSYRLLNGNNSPCISSLLLNFKIYIPPCSDQLNSPIITYLLQNHWIFCNWNYPTSLTTPSSPCFSTCPWCPSDPSSDSLNYTRSYCPFPETTLCRMSRTKSWPYLLLRIRCFPISCH